jgi:predicted enzyme related to lactoylglutathione lyase
MMSTKGIARMHSLKIAVAVARTSTLVLAAALFTIPANSLLPFANSANARQSISASSPSVAVGPQYDSTHVYVAGGDLDAFVKSFTATFGGQSSKASVTTVTPTPSSTEFQSVQTPFGTLSVFAFQTPIPFPFGQERTGYLVTNMDTAIKAARSAGAEIIVEPFKDPIGMDAVIQWPGGVKMQLYWHFTAPTYPPLETIPDNRVYVSRDQAESFVSGFVRFAHGKIISDDKNADAGEIGRAGETYRRIRITSQFGNMQVLVTDGHLPFPFGHEIMGYDVKDLAATLDKAKAAGVEVLSLPYKMADRISAIVEFPGGYIAEVHSMIAR